METSPPTPDVGEREGSSMFSPAFKAVPHTLWNAIRDCYHDEDGYWLVLNDGWHLEGYAWSDHMIHEDTMAEFKEAAKCIRKDS